MKNGEDGATPCSGVIQRNRRDALCFKWYVIGLNLQRLLITWLTGSALCLENDWRADGGVWVSVVWSPQVSLFPYCTFAMRFLYNQTMTFTDWEKSICIFWVVLWRPANIWIVELVQMCAFLSESSVPAEVVAAVDVNTTANEIYKHNFPNTPLLPKTIEVCLPSSISISYLHN